MLDLNEIAVFVKVVDSNSFTAAARALAMPKATVSRKVAELETQLGVRLLERTTRKLRLTEAGLDFYRRCSDNIAALEEASAAVSEAQHEPQGTLRITLPTVGQPLLSALLSEFMAVYPKVSFEIVFSDELLDLIDAGFDLAFRGGQLRDSSLIARKLGPTQPAICASPDYLAKHGTPQRPDDLRRHDCIVLDTSSENHSWEFHTPDGKQLIEVSGRVKANDVTFILHAVCSALGIARLPLFAVAEAIRQGRLVTLLDAYNPNFGDIYVVYPSRRHLPAKVRAFVDFLEQRMRPNPPWLVNLKT